MPSLKKLFVEVTGQQKVYSKTLDKFMAEETHTPIRKNAIPLNGDWAIHEEIGELTKEAIKDWLGHPRVAAVSHNRALERIAELEAWRAIVESTLDQLFKDSEELKAWRNGKYDGNVLLRHAPGGSHVKESGGVEFARPPKHNPEPQETPRRHTHMALVVGFRGDQFQQIQDRLKDAPVALVHLAAEKGLENEALPTSVDKVFVSKFVGHAGLARLRATYPKDRFLHIDGGINSMVSAIRESFGG